MRAHINVGVVALAALLLQQLALVPLTAADVPHLAPPGLSSGIVINIPQALLFFKANEAVVAAYPVGLGRPSWPTFVGPFTVVEMEEDPTWDVPPSIQEELRRAGKPVLTQVPPGPSNPLGKYFLRLSMPNYGIHGTNAPASVGRYQTHGCIRMLPVDVADLWTKVSVGMPGEIVYETILLDVTEEGVILLEAHRDVYRREDGAAADRVRARAEELHLSDKLDWTVVRAALAKRDGMPHPVGQITWR